MSACQPLELNVLDVYKHPAMKWNLFFLMYSGWNPAWSCPEIHYQSKNKQNIAENMQSHTENTSAWNK